jgi:hypothetical protein
VARFGLDEKEMNLETTSFAMRGPSANSTNIFGQPTRYLNT